MVPDRTELEWVYKPTDFFEVRYQNTNTEYDLVVENGRIVASLITPQSPIPADLEGQVKTHVESIFLVRQFQIHREFTLQGPRVYQHKAEQKVVNIRLGAAISVTTSVGTPDIIIRDQAGNIVRDTRAERIAADTVILDSIAPKLIQSSELRGMLMSYSKSIADPSDEFVHLYEIRDVLKKYYRGERNARVALNISANEWSGFGVLTNVKPLKQGRHRGQNIGGLRAASREELEKARSIARNWIIAFAQTV